MVTSTLQVGFLDRTASVPILVRCHLTLLLSDVEVAREGRATSSLFLLVSAPAATS